MERGLFLDKGLLCGVVKHSKLGSGGNLQLCEYAKIISLHALRGVIFILQELYLNNAVVWFLFLACLLLMYQRG